MDIPFYWQPKQYGIDLVFYTGIDFDYNSAVFKKSSYLQIDNGYIKGQGC